jgi:methanogenic corrinoid protein MtbC1
VICWCSYCQRFLEEVPPLEDYSITHSICETCLKSGYADDVRRIKAMEALAIYYSRLQAASDAGDFVHASTLIDEGLSLGLKIGDLACGVLQPLLYRIGDRWAKGELSVVNEHKFSATAVAAIELLFTKDAVLQPRRQHREPDVLLVMAEGNYHSLGLRFVELGICLKGSNTHTVMPGLPAKEVVALVQSLRPKVLGVSVALAPQMKSVRELRDMLRDLRLEDRPRLVIGGSAVRLGLEVPEAWGIEVSKNYTLDVSSRHRPQMTPPLGFLGVSDSI